MRTTDKYGFKLIIEEPGMNARTVVVCPRYNGLKLKWSRPSGKMYFEKSLSGTVKLWGIDFKTVYNCALRTKFTLIVYERNKGEIARCDFRKTDCKWDVDHTVCEIDVSSQNPYKKIESSKDNEYNLVRLGLDKKTLNFYVYPQNQIYFQEDNIISLFSNTGDGAQPSVTPTHDNNKLASNTSEGNMNFSDDPILVAVVKVEGDSDFNGLYSGIYKAPFTYHSNFGFGTTMKCASLTKITGTGTKSVYLCRGTGDYSNVICLGFTNYGVNDLVGYVPTHRGISQLYGLTSATVQVQKSALESATLQITCRVYVVYYGMATMRENADFPIPNDDITSSFNHNYKYRIPTYPYPQDVIGIIGLSNRTSNTDKGYGRVENTSTYYDKPDDENTWLPVKKDSWFEGHSIWIKPLNVNYNQYTYWSGATFVDDFYLLGDSIKAVLHEIDPDLHFEPDVTHSQFLFSRPSNPVSGEQQGDIYISQKSNVLNLGYDYPAWLAPITWGRIETMLNNAFNCYTEIFEVNGERHLRIEHRSWFEKGGTYQGDDPRQTHLLSRQYRNSTSYTYADKTNHWEWDKDGGTTTSNASRYEYGWMDTQSAIFDGRAIVVPDDEVLFEDERVEERKVDWFSTDIDFLSSVQSECSSDGFVMVMESPSENGWIINSHPNYSGQNYQLSLEYLQTIGRYLFAGIYSKTLKVGDTLYPNVNLYPARMRKAEVEFRLKDDETMEAGDILVTEVGQGVADSVELDLSSGAMTATVRYKNE